MDGNPGSCSFPNGIGQKDRDISGARVSSGKLTEAERKNPDRLFVLLESAFCQEKDPSRKEELSVREIRNPQRQLSKRVTRLYQFHW